MLGVRIPEFRILSRLRQGGTATVYVAERIDAPGRLALKLLHPEVSADAERRARFLAASLALSGVDHPGLAPPMMILDRPGLVGVAMQLLDGESLAERLARGPLSAVEAASIGAQAAAALSAAHQAGVMHGDLQPSDLFLEAGGGVRLLGFGQCDGEACEAGADLSALGALLASARRRQVPGPHRAAASLALLAAGGLLLSAALASSIRPAWDPTAAPPGGAFLGEAPEIPSLAVLPPSRPGPELILPDRFEVGVADAVITALSGRREIRVRPTSAVEPFATGRMEPIAVGRDLGVSHVLSGEILSREGRGVSLRLRLQEVRSGRTLWEETVGLEAGDRWSLQTAAAREVLRRLSDLSPAQWRLLT